jgi:hypothetical protein
MTDPQKMKDFFHNYSIHREMALYAKTGRPIHAWRAYRWIREAGLPVPPWFLEYLDECAERCDKIDPKSPEQVAAAFAMDGVGRNASVGSDQLAAVQDVAALKARNPGARVTDLFKQVAKAGRVSDSYVRDAYYKWFPKK